MNALRFRPGILLALCTLPLAACATRGGEIAYNPTDFRAPDAPPSALTGADYRLSPGDVITVRVFELETLTGDQTVDQTGRISLPLIGMIPADGRTTAQFQSDLETRLQKDYLQAPHVVVTLKTAAIRTVTVDGAVEQPGIYPIAPATTLIQTVSLARGVSDNANPKRVVIFRQIGGTRRAAAYDLTTIRKGTDADPSIYPGDVVVVDGSGMTEAYRTLLRSVPLVGLLARF